MNPCECLLCKSKMREGTTEFMAKVGEQVVVIKNIPAFVCPNCDESHSSREIAPSLRISATRFGPISLRWSFGMRTKLSPRTM
jgi:YgiT-type zinc finger domain-containing protein